MNFEIQWTPEAESQFKALQASAEKAVLLGRTTKPFGLF